MRFGKQALQIFVRAVSLGDAVIIAHIIARINKRRIKTRIQPNRIAANVLDIIQFRDNALYIADTVRIRVAKTLRINLVKNRFFEPISFTHNKPRLKMRFYFRTALFLSQIKKKSDVTMLVKIIVMLKLGSESLRVHLKESPRIQYVSHRIYQFFERMC